MSGQGIKVHTSPIKLSEFCNTPFPFPCTAWHSEEFM